MSSKIKNVPVFVKFNCPEQSSENITAYIVTDNQGLCLAASPNIKAELAGIVSAIAKQAAKIETGGPVVLLENDQRQCLINEERGVTTALFKKNISQ